MEWPGTKKEKTKNHNLYQMKTRQSPLDSKMTSKKAYHKKPAEKKLTEKEKEPTEKKTYWKNTFCKQNSTEKKKKSQLKKQQLKIRSLPKNRQTNKTRLKNFTEKKTHWKTKTTIWKISKNLNRQKKQNLWKKLLFFF